MTLIQTENKWLKRIAELEAQLHAAQQEHSLCADVIGGFQEELAKYEDVLNTDGVRRLQEDYILISKQLEQAVAKLAVCHEKLEACGNLHVVLDLHGPCRAKLAVYEAQLAACQQELADIDGTTVSAKQYLDVLATADARGRELDRYKEMLKDISTHKELHGYDA
jgi:chromosome segregation ATPase